MIQELVDTSVKLINNAELSYKKWKNINTEQKPEVVLIYFCVLIVNTETFP